MTGNDDQAAHLVSNHVAARLDALEAKIDALAGLSGSTPSAPKATDLTVAAVMMSTSLSATVAAALVSIETSILQSDAALLQGRTEDGAGYEYAAVGLACRTLSRVRDDFRMPDGSALNFEVDPWELNEDDQPVLDLVAETDLLHLVGLSHDLAAKHVDLADENWKHESHLRPRTSSDVLQRLHEAADAVCEAKTFIETTWPDTSTERRRRGALRWGGWTVGGVLIVVANTAATGFMGAIPASASIAMGSTSAGATSSRLLDWITPDRTGGK